jgi:hypothetical protein
MFLWPWESPVTVTGGTQQQRDHYNNVVNKVLGTPRGQQLKSEINGPWYWHGKPQEIKLEPGIGYGTGAVFEKSGNGAPVSTNTVEIDPNFHPPIQTAAGVVTPSDERIVGHELGHSVTGTLDDGPKDMNNVKQNENPIVKALGLSPRTQYAPPPPPPVKPPQEVAH